MRLHYLPSPTFSYLGWMATPMIGVLSCRCFQSASLLLHHTVRWQTYVEDFLPLLHTEAETSKLTEFPPLNTWAVIKVTPVGLNSSLILTQFPSPPHNTEVSTPSSSAHLNAVTTLELNSSWVAMSHSVCCTICQISHSVWSLLLPGSMCDARLFQEAMLMRVAGSQITTQEKVEGKHSRNPWHQSHWLCLPGTLDAWEV